MGTLDSTSDATPSRRQHVQALALALLCSILFLRDALLPGRALVPFSPHLHDVYLLEAHARGTLDQEAIATGHVGMGDKYFQSLCWDRVHHERMGRGEFPRWTRDIGAGAPLAPQMAQPFHPLNLLLLASTSETWYGWAFLLQQVLFAWSAYAFLRRIGSRHGSALFGLTVAALGLWLQARLHHHVVISAALPVWLMLLATHALTTPDAAPGTTDGRRAPRSRIAAVLALATALSWLSGFAPVSLQATAITLLHGCARSFLLPREQRRACLSWLATAMLVGACSSAANTIPIVLAWLESARRAHFDESALAAVGLDAADLLTMVWPDLLNQPIDRIYAASPGTPPNAWFVRQPWSQFVLLREPVHAADGRSPHVWVETSFSIGASGTLCALFAWSSRRHRRLATGAAIVFVLALGFATASPFFVALSRWLPGMQAGDLRRLLFAAAVAATVLAALGVDGIAERPKARSLALAAAMPAALSAVAVAWLWHHSDTNAFVDAMVRLHAGTIDDTLADVVRRTAAPGEAELNHERLLVTAIRALLVTGAVASIDCFATQRRAALLITVALAELLHIGHAAVRTVPADDVRRLPAVLQPVADHAAPNGVRPRLGRLMARRSRIDEGFPGNLAGFHGLEDTGFYSALAPLRAQEFFLAIEPDADDKTPVTYRTSGVGALHERRSLHHPLLDLLGVRFVLCAPTTVEQTPPEEASIPTWIDRTPERTGGYRLLERTQVLPRATFVSEIDVLPDRAERLLALSRADRDVAHRTVLEVAPQNDRRPSSTQVPPHDAAVVSIIEHRDEQVIVDVDAPRDGYLRLADPYDAGWRATVDGHATTVLIADHWLRAVAVPEGRHRVVFSYDAPRVLWPPRLSVLGLLIAGLLAFKHPRRRP